MPAVTLLSDACLSLARGEILQREQAGTPSTRRSSSTWSAAG